MKRSFILGLTLFVAGFLASRLIQTVSGPSCAGALELPDGDVNGDGTLDLSDPVHLLQFLFLGGPPPVPCQPLPQPVSTVVIVRHAEREESGVDPGLTPEGLARADHLAQVLKHTKPDLFVVSSFRRTLQTLQPLIDLNPSTPWERVDEPEDVVARLNRLSQGSLAIVAHHSYTIHEILAGLGIEDSSDIDVDDENFDNFIIVMRPPGQKPQLLHLTY